jgi:hypothetical protein
MLRAASAARVCEHLERQESALAVLRGEQDLMITSGLKILLTPTDCTDPNLSEEIESAKCLVRAKLHWLSHLVNYKIPKVSKLGIAE